MHPSHGRPFSFSLFLNSLCANYYFMYTHYRDCDLLRLVIVNMFLIRLWWIRYIAVFTLRKLCLCRQIVSKNGLPSTTQHTYTHKRIHHSNENVISHHLHVHKILSNIKFRILAICSIVHSQVPLFNGSSYLRFAPLGDSALIWLELKVSIILSIYFSLSPHIYYQRQACCEVCLSLYSLLRSFHVPFVSLCWDVQMSFFSPAISRCATVWAPLLLLLLLLQPLLLLLLLLNKAKFWVRSYYFCLLLAVVPVWWL